jgi:CubicO group peptidase (beta-lactamase class C family)
MNKFGLILMLGLLGIISPVFAGSDSDTGYQQLETRIQTILNETRTAGASVAIVQSNGHVWQKNFGVADISTQQPISNSSIFRLGSISKMLVSFAVMSLVEDGKLSLDDEVRALVPEIAFYNPWEEQHPLQVSHLLEHTTGWDAPHFAELASNEQIPVAIIETLSLHPHSRSSRWAPGSRSAYNQTGPLVAAYIVEKLTGVTFEDYIKDKFLDPLGMTNTSYFYNENFRNNGVTNYREGRPQPYWHIANRAAGGLNSNINDMIRFVQFILSRGMLNDLPILLDTSIAVTEAPYSSLSAQAGMQLNWGLGNFTFHKNGYLYNGHQGSLFGSNAIIAYQKDLGVAHIVMTNSETPASSQIHALLSEFETVEPKELPFNAFSITQEHIELSGYYRPINPIREDGAFLTNLLPWVLSVDKDSAFIAPLLGSLRRELIPSRNGSFLQNTTGAVALVKVIDPVAGEVIHYGPQTLKKISVISAYLPLIILAIWIISALFSVVFVFIWVPRLLLKHIKNGPTINLRLWPLLSTLAMLTIVALLLEINSSTFPNKILGSVNFLSVSITISTIAFALFSLISCYIVYQLRHEPMNRLVFWHSSLLAVTSLLISLYLFSYGMIGLRIWT